MSLSGIVGQPGIEHRVQRVAGHRDQAEGVAVGRRAREFGHADVAARPALVLDHEGLAQALGELVADQAAHRVGAAARREGADEAHGLGGPGSLSVSDRRRRKCADQQGPSLHVVSSMFVLAGSLPHIRVIQNFLPARCEDLHLRHTTYICDTPQLCLARAPTHDRTRGMLPCLAGRRACSELNALTQPSVGRC